MRKTLALLALASTLAATFRPHAANAQPAPKSLSPADLAKAKALFDAGGRAYDGGDFATALQAFEQAYAIAPRDGILFSIAQANRRLYTTTNERPYLERAVQGYKQYLAAVQSGGRRAEATRALGDLEVLLGGKTVEVPVVSAPKPAARKTLIAIDSPTPGALISIDGAEAKPPQVTAEVSAGAHEVKLTAPGFEEKKVTVRALEGELTPVSYELAERPGRLLVTKADGSEVSVDGRFVGTAPFAKPIELPSGPHFVSVTRNGHESWGADVELERGVSKSLSADLRSTTQRKVSYGLFAVGGAGIVASAVVLGMSVAKESSARSTLTKLNTQAITQADVDAYRQDKIDRDNFRTAGGVLAAGGVAVAVVGVLLYAIDTPRPLAASAPRKGSAPSKPDDKTERPSIDLSVVPVVSPTEQGIFATARF